MEDLEKKQDVQSFMKLGIIIVSLLTVFILIVRVPPIIDYMQEKEDLICIEGNIEYYENETKEVDDDVNDQFHIKLQQYEADFFLQDASSAESDNSLKHIIDVQILREKFKISDECQIYVFKRDVKKINGDNYIPIQEAYIHGKCFINYKDIQKAEQFNLSIDGFYIAMSVGSYLFFIYYYIRWDKITFDD